MLKIVVIVMTLYNEKLPENSNKIHSHFSFKI